MTGYLRRGKSTVDHQTQTELRENKKNSPNENPRRKRRPVQQSKQRRKTKRKH